MKHLHGHVTGTRQEQVLLELKIVQAAAREGMSRMKIGISLVL
jgi:hypothetical protein